MKTKPCLSHPIGKSSPTNRTLVAGLIIATAMAGLAGHAQADVTIVYPVNGGSYPITDPAPGQLKSAYITASFSGTCPGGGHKFEWGFDSTTLGTEGFYDQTSVQLIYKLPGGDHTFWAKAGDKCGANGVKFKIGQ